MDCMDNLGVLANGGRAGGLLGLMRGVKKINHPMTMMEQLVVNQ